MVEEKETEVLDDLFVKLQGVSTAMVPSSTSSTQEPATTCDNNFTNNGAVITSPELPSSIAGGAGNNVEQPSNCISTQDQHSSNSVTSSPVKSQPQNHANTLVPESGEQTANPPDQSTGPRQVVAEDVTTTQPQAQPKDPNLMPSTAAATTAES